MIHLLQGSRLGHGAQGQAKYPLRGHDRVRHSRQQHTVLHQSSPRTSVVKSTLVAALCAALAARSASCSCSSASTSAIQRDPCGPCKSASARAASSACRAEEHTSEPQSLMRISYAVFCLKKKKAKAK